MSILEIRIFPDPVLKTPCREVTEFDGSLKKFLNDMAETMRDAHGIGLAAPQVGVSQRIAVVDVSDEGNELINLVNPKIVTKNGKVPSEEGCLSIPEYRETVQRASDITVEAQDADGKHFQIKADGLLAICIQHEIDHLDGVLFIDRLSRLKREFFRQWWKRQTA